MSFFIILQDLTNQYVSTFILYFYDFRQYQPHCVAAFVLLLCAHHLHYCRIWWAFQMQSALEMLFANRIWLLVRVCHRRHLCYLWWRACTFSVAMGCPETIGLSWFGFIDSLGVLYFPLFLCCVAFRDHHCSSKWNSIPIDHQEKGLGKYIGILCVPETQVYCSVCVFLAIYFPW